MADQHGGGHGAHAAGYRGNGLDEGFCLVKADVAAELALCVDVDAHIDHDLAFAQAVAADEALPPHGNDHDVGLFAEGGQVLGAGIAERHRGVFAVQHHGGGLADHEAAAHDHGPPTRERHLIILQDLQTGLCGAGRVADGGVGKHTGQRTVRDAVDVLFRGQRRADGAVIELPGQRAEEQTAMDRRVCVDLPEARPAQHLRAE